MSTTLVIVLLIPLVVLGLFAMIAAFAFAMRTGTMTRQDGRKKESEECPACGHKLLEMLNYCPKCGSPIRPSAHPPQ